MQQEAADELFGLQCHRLLLGAMTIILVTERHLALRDIQQTIIGDRYAMSVAPEVVQHLLGSSERPLGVDHPFGLA
jgi:hypothetical protein